MHSLKHKRLLGISHRICSQQKAGKKLGEPKVVSSLMDQGITHNVNPVPQIENIDSKIFKIPSV